MAVRIARHGAVTVVTLDRPEVRNAVDGEHAQALYEAFEAFEADSGATVAVLHGAGGSFCAGADLKSVAAGTMPVWAPGEGRGPMGPTRMMLSKPVVAAVEGHAVAGGLELALWCDLRVADPAAVFGVYCRRWGVPLIDGGTVRLPRLIGQSHALDLILTGRAVAAAEAKAIGLVNHVSAPGQALGEALALAERLANFPQICMRQDRLSLYGQADLPMETALAAEWEHGMISLSADAGGGAARFAAGHGRHGDFSNL
jgi:enoyl-CoA hydratase